MSNNPQEAVFSDGTLRCDRKGFPSFFFHSFFLRLFFLYVYTEYDKGRALVHLPARATDVLSSGDRL